MQLTLFSDYALRVALYLGCHDDHLVTAGEISRAYGISNAHLVKVVQRLTELDVVEAVRGRGGGLRLAKRPADIAVGALVRATEPNLDLVECFDTHTNTCPIVPACALKGVLERARRAFLAELDRYTLADFITRGDRLIPLWDAQLRRHAPR
jgi:Rrf2 family transcriptional regulator, nitric oxide-sensitive transcriptional repressor